MQDILFPVAALLIVICVSARDVVFPPVLSLKRSQRLLGQDNGIDIGTSSEFNSLTTSANSPYANCFDNSDIASYDVAILGSLFDTVSLA